MPRLVGEQKNHSASIGLLFLAVAGVAVGLEYVGATDFIPGFGRTSTYLSGENLSSNSHSAMHQEFNESR